MADRKKMPASADRDLVRELSKPAVPPQVRLLIGLTPGSSWEAMKVQLMSAGFDHLAGPRPELPDVATCLVPEGMSLGAAVAAATAVAGVAFAEADQYRTTM